MTEREFGHHFKPRGVAAPVLCAACGLPEYAIVHHASRLKPSLFEQQLREVSVAVSRAHAPDVYRTACRKPWTPGRMVCAEHADEQDAEAQRQRDAIARDGLDLLYSLGAAAILLLAGCEPTTTSKLTTDCCEYVDAGGEASCVRRTVKYRTLLGIQSRQSDADACADFGLEPYP
jgi:hypothetical protein